MGKLTAMTLVSLDGVMQAPGGPDEDTSGGFAHGGWAVPFIGDELLEATAALTGRADVLLLGRGTYEIFAATWPLAGSDDPVGSKLNAMPKFVATSRPGELAWHNTTRLAGDVRALKRQTDGEIQVHGSPGLLQTLLDDDLVDEFRVFTFPVLLGAGVRLFGAGTGPARLRLVDTVAFAGGVVGSTYARDGALTYGAMGPETGNW